LKIKPNAGRCRLRHLPASFMPLSGETPFHARETYGIFFFPALATPGAACYSEAVLMILSRCRHAFFPRRGRFSGKGSDLIKISPARAGKRGPDAYKTFKGAHGSVHDRSKRL